MLLSRRDARPDMSLQLDITRLGEGRDERLAAYISTAGGKQVCLFSGAVQREEYARVLGRRIRVEFEPGTGLG